MATLYIRTDIFDHGLLPQLSQCISHSTIKNIIGYLSPFTTLDYKISAKQVTDAIQKYMPSLTPGDCNYFVTQYYKLISEEIDSVVHQGSENDKNIDIRCLSVYLYLQTYNKKSEAINLKKQFNDSWPVKC
jgi:hypothetical protein